MLIQFFGLNFFFVFIELYYYCVFDSVRLILIFFMYENIILSKNNVEVDNFLIKLQEVYQVRVKVFMLENELDRFKVEVFEKD